MICSNANNVVWFDVIFLEEHYGTERRKLLGNQNRRTSNAKGKKCINLPPLTLKTKHLQFIKLNTLYAVQISTFDYM